jgi:plastocyanin
VSRAKKAAKSKIPAHTVRVGLSAPGLELYNMFPGTLTVKRGTVVTFSMSPQSYEAHTATFGPAKYLNGLAKAFEAPKIPGAAAFPSDPTQPLVLSRGSHGNGFANTGVIDMDRSTPTNPTSSKIEFAQTGTYHYICLIHPWMRGTIVVK